MGAAAFRARECGGGDETRDDKRIGAAVRVAERVNVGKRVAEPHRFTDDADMILHQAA